jgi:dsDNA-specific endonuclease/ATPase MutS2
MSASKHQPIAAAFMFAFEGNLQRKDVDTVEEIVGDLEDLGSVLEEDETLRFRDLPQVIPEVVRKRMVALSQQKVTAHNELFDMLSQLDRVAGKIFDKKDAEATAALPHCPTCGHLVPKAKRGR